MTRCIVWLKETETKKSSLFTILYSHWLCIQNSKKKINEQDRRDFGHDRSKIEGGYIAVSSLSEVEKLHKCIWVYIIYSMCEISNPNLNLEPERIC